MRGLNRYTLYGILLCICGLFYYANVRQTPVIFEYLALLQWLKLANPIDKISSFIDAWLLSFIYILSVCSVSFGLLKNTKISLYSIVTFWLCFAVVFELFQLNNSEFYIFRGTFDGLDILALILGSLLSYKLLSKVERKKEFNQNNSIIVKKVVLLLFGTYGVLGSYYPHGNYCEYPDGSRQTCMVEPIYMSMSQIRNSDEIFFDSTNSQHLADKWSHLGYKTQGFYGVDNAAKIIIYHDYLFVNDRFKGTHVFDNSEPATPKHIAYFRIVGNQDIAIKDNILYLDSYTDIVAIDLYQLNYGQIDDDLYEQPDDDNLGYVQHDPRLTPMRRNLDVLETPETTHLLPPRVYFSESTPERGIVIGYTTKSSDKFYFWDLEL
ncbi:MAG: hypothetical protein ACJAZB_000396 [Psychrosphaera sp.]|jgi:hypothetical protein